MAATTPVLLLVVLISSLSLYVGTVHICDVQCPPPGFLCNPDGCLLPDNPFVFIGRNLTLNCTLRYSNRSTDLNFTWQNDLIIPSEYQQVTSPYDLQLNMPVKEDAPKAFTVQCKDNVVTGLPWTQRVFIDCAPEITNFEVLVYDWSYAAITWDTPTYRQTNAKVNTTVIWTAEGAASWYYCDVYNETYCLLDKSYRDSNRYNISIHIVYSFMDVERENITKHLDFYSAAHVKPSPATSLEVVNTPSRSLVLKWQHEKAVSRRLMFRVIGTRGNNEIFSETTEGYNTTVTDLRPFTTHHFVILTKSVHGGYWSDPASISVTTLQDKPDRGPRVEPGGYHGERCEDNSKKVLIYIKPPDEEYMNGNLIHYTLTFVPSDGRPSFTSTPAAHLVHDVAYLSCNIDYSVSISVSTSKGASPSSDLHIPRYGSVTGPLSVKVEHINTTLGRVHWEAAPQATPISWTVFWCTSSTTSFTSQISESCQDAISWTRVNGSQRSLDIDKEWSGSVIYGVSMTTQTGSSGIRWNDCVYDATKAPTGKPQIGTVESRPNLGLTVRWLLPTCDDDTLITHYIIQWCPNNSDVCESSYISSDYSEHVIPSLREGVAYSVTLRQVAVSQKAGQFSDPVIGVPVNTALKAGQIVGIVFGFIVVLVLILAVAALCFRYSRRKWREKELIVMPRHLQDYVLGLSFESPPLPERRDQLEILQTQTLTNGCVRHISIDSGRGSLSSVAVDTLISPGQSPVPMSPNDQFKPVFDPVEEEGSLSGSGSKRNSTGVSKQTIAQGYAVIALEGSSVYHGDVSSPGDQTVTTTQEEDCGFSGGFSNDGFDDEADSVPPYVTAGKGGDDCSSPVCNSGSSGSEILEDKEEKDLNLGFCVDEETDIQSRQYLKDIDVKLLTEKLNCLTDSGVSRQNIICLRAMSSSPSPLSTADSVDHNQSLWPHDHTAGNCPKQSGVENNAGCSTERDTSKAAHDMTSLEGQSVITQVPADEQRSDSVSPDDEGLGSLESGSGSLVSDIHKDAELGPDL